MMKEQQFGWQHGILRPILGGRVPFLFVVILDIWKIEGSRRCKPVNIFWIVMIIADIYVYINAILTMK